MPGNDVAEAIKNLQELRKLFTTVKSRYHKRVGKRDQLLDQISKDFGVETLEEAKGKLVDLELNYKEVSEQLVYKHQEVKGKLEAGLKEIQKLEE